MCARRSTSRAGHGTAAAFDTYHDPTTMLVDAAGAGEDSMDRVPLIQHEKGPASLTARLNCYGAAVLSSAGVEGRGAPPPCEAGSDLAPPPRRARVPLGLSGADARRYGRGEAEADAGGGGGADAGARAGAPGGAVAWRPALLAEQFVESVARRHSTANVLVRLRRRVVLGCARARARERASIVRAHVPSRGGGGLLFVGVSVFLTHISAPRHAPRARGRGDLAANAAAGSDESMRKAHARNNELLRFFWACVHGARARD